MHKVKVARTQRERREIEAELDRELEQTFPASDATTITRYVRKSYTKPRLNERPPAAKPLRAGNQRLQKKRPT